MGQPTYGFILMALFSLTGCMAAINAETALQEDGIELNSPPPDEAGEIVENPDAFSRRDEGLWDGRPSFGGVWVAHPDVKVPERVIIRNIETGQETIGALFRREHMNPGPAFQVSNEAAYAIGILAGAPTILEVIALQPDRAEPGV